MSHILEEYTKCLGDNYSKPIIDTHFFPIVADRYITVETAPESFNSLNYSYWHNVVDLIKKYDPEISFIDISHGKEKTLDCFDQSIQGACSYRQLSYIISKSQAHICIDSYTGHLASLSDTPTTTLHSHLPPEVSKPIWHDTPTNHKSLFGSSGDIKPSYSKDDPENLIDKIKPEDIATDVLDKIGVKHDLKDYSTVNIGRYYKDNILEIIPDFNADDFTQTRLINLRCDYNFDLELIKDWLRFKVNLMFDKPIPIETLLQHRSNIAGMTIFIKDESISPSYVNQLKQSRFAFGLVCPNNDIISDIRLDFFETDVEEYKIKDKKSLDFHEDICDNSYYLSNKTLISKNKEYKSKAHWMNKDTIKDDSKVIDCPEFWEEVQHFNIYNHGKKEG